MPDKSLFKIICMSSLITGAILGFFPLIPPLTGLALSFLILVPAPFIIFYLYKLKLINKPDTSNCLSIGAISGFISFLGFSLVYFPLALILYLIFKIDSFFIVKIIVLNPMFLFFMVFLTATLSAMFNMFSAFISLYFFDLFNNKN